SLLPGETGIFYEGTYVGKGFIDPKSTKDTMKLSIGRDKKIVITRERDKKLRATKLLGSTVNDTYAYTIAVRNTRKQKATIEIEDQMPVSNDKDIVVETIDNDKAEYDAPTGKMKWTLELQPGETKKITFSYSITYPKGKRINGLP
ncbi:MAG: DUF4139 domain-containing protein, partial [Chitinophagia bacterium]|nr:DUF4139 domain-containing protein [Chitinophagia bacterium]